MQPRAPFVGGVLAGAVLAFGAAGYWWRSDGDELKFIGSSSTAIRQAVLAGPPSDCIPSILGIGVERITLGLISDHPCQRQLHVFESGQGMRTHEVDGVFTAAKNDRHTLSLKGQPLRIQKIVIRIVRGAFSVHRDRALLDVRRAAQIFDMQACGVDFDLVGPPQDATAQWNYDETKLCDFAKQLPATLYSTDALNVYYTDKQLPGARGKWCPLSPRVALVGGGADNEVLAHEIGHAFSLDDYPEPENVMRDSASGRYAFSMRQCYEQNHSSYSLLNANAR